MKTTAPTTTKKFDSNESKENMMNTRNQEHGGLFPVDKSIKTSQVAGLQTIDVTDFIRSKNDAKLDCNQSSDSWGNNTFSQP